MPKPLRRTLLCLLVAALAAFAHRPLLRAGFAGGDLALLREAAAHARSGAPSFPAWLAGGSVRPLPAAVLLANAHDQPEASPLDPATALPLRAVALAALLLAAAGAGVTVRRVLVPWLGESAGRAAGWACAGFVVAHPASVAAVARPASLGDLFAVAAGAWCVAFLLRGRQERSTGLLLVAAVLAVAAGFSSKAAWILPFLATGLEMTSARRPRPALARLSSALAVGAVAWACVSIEPAMSWPKHLPERGFSAWTSQPLAQRALAAIEALGSLVLPAPGSGDGWSYVVAGALLLVALEPLLRAVRAAPRLWGWLILGWLACLAVALAIASDRRVPAGRAELAQTLWPASVVLCAGLAAAAASLGGARRSALPIALALGLCWIADRTARVWPAATRELLALRAELADARAAAGPGGKVLALGVALDPDGVGVPAPLDAVGLPWAEHVAWSGPEPCMQRCSAEALPYVLRLPEGEAWRARGLAVSLPPGAEAPRRTVRIPPRTAAAKPVAWRDEGRSEILDVDPLQLTAVRVTPRPGVSTGEPPRMGWRSASKEFEIGLIQGAWLQTDDGPRAIFDLARSTEWLLGGTVKRIWFENQLLSIASAEVLPSLPLPEVDLAGVLAPDGRVLVPPAARPRALLGSVRWVLVQAEVREALFHSWEGRLEGDEHVVFPDARARTPGRVDPRPDGYRVLECRVDGTTVARTPAIAVRDL